MATLRDYVPGYSGGSINDLVPTQSGLPEATPLIATAPLTQEFERNGMTQTGLGYKSSRLSDQANWMEVEAATRETAGDTQGAQTLRGQINGLRQQAAFYAPAEQDITKVGLNPGRILDYGLGAVGSMGASMQDSLLAGGAVRGAGALLKQSNNPLVKGAGLAAAFVPNLLSNSGEQLGQYQEDKNIMATTTAGERLARGLGTGAVMGALDTLPEAGILSRVAGKGVGAGILRNTAMDVGKEAATEVAQTGVQKLDLNLLNPNRDGSEDWRDYANAAAQAGLGSTPMHGASNVLGAMGNRIAEPGDPGTQRGDDIDLKTGKKLDGSLASLDEQLQHVGGEKYKADYEAKKARSGILDGSAFNDATTSDEMNAAAEDRRAALVEELTKAGDRKSVDFAAKLGGMSAEDIMLDPLVDDAAKHIMPKAGLDADSLKRIADGFKNKRPKNNERNFLPGEANPESVGGLVDTSKMASVDPKKFAEQKAAFDEMTTRGKTAARLIEDSVTGGGDDARLPASQRGMLRDIGQELAAMSSVKGKPAPGELFRAERLGRIVGSMLGEEKVTTALEQAGKASGAWGTPLFSAFLGNAVRASGKLTKQTVEEERMSRNDAATQLMALVPADKEHALAKRGINLRNESLQHWLLDGMQDMFDGDETRVSEKKAVEMFGAEAVEGMRELLGKRIEMRMPGEKLGTESQKSEKLSSDDVVEGSEEGADFEAKQAAKRAEKSATNTLIFGKGVKGKGVPLIDALFRNKGRQLPALVHIPEGADRETRKQSGYALEAMMTDYGQLPGIKRGKVGKKGSAGSSGYDLAPRTMASLMDEHEVPEDKRQALLNEYFTKEADGTGPDAEAAAEAKARLGTVHQGRKLLTALNDRIEKNTPATRKRLSDEFARSRSGVQDMLKKLGADSGLDGLAIALAALDVKTAREGEARSGVDETSGLPADRAISSMLSTMPQDKLVAAAKAMESYIAGQEAEAKDFVNTATGGHKKYFGERYVVAATSRDAVLNSDSLTMRPDEFRDMTDHAKVAKDTIRRNALVTAENGRKVVGQKKLSDLTVTEGFMQFEDPANDGQPIFLKASDIVNWVRGSELGADSNGTAKGYDAFIGYLTQGIAELNRQGFVKGMPYIEGRDGAMHEFGRKLTDEELNDAYEAKLKELDRNKTLSDTAKGKIAGNHVKRLAKLRGVPAEMHVDGAPAYDQVRGVGSALDDAPLPGKDMSREFALQQQQADHEYGTGHEYNEQTGQLVAEDDGLNETDDKESGLKRDVDAKQSLEIFSAITAKGDGSITYNKDNAGTKAEGVADRWWGTYLKNPQQVFALLKSLTEPYHAGPMSAFFTPERMELIKKDGVRNYEAAIALRGRAARMLLTTKNGLRGEARTAAAERLGVDTLNFDGMIEALTSMAKVGDRMAAALNAGAKERKAAREAAQSLATREAAVHAAVDKEKLTANERKAEKLEAELATVTAKIAEMNSAADKAAGGKKLSREDYKTPAQRKLVADATRLQNEIDALRAKTTVPVYGGPKSAAPTTQAPTSKPITTQAPTQKSGSVASPIIGDLWAQDGVKVVSTNLGGVHGRGLAKQAADKGLITRANVDFDSSPKGGVVTLAVKGKAPETAKVPGRAFSEQVVGGNLELLKSEFRKLVRHARANPDTHFYLPFVGLGFGEGNPADIMPVLEKVASEPNIFMVSKDQGTVDKYAESFKPGVRADATSRTATGLATEAAAAIQKRQDYLDNPPADYTTEKAKSILSWAKTALERADARKAELTGDALETLADNIYALKRLVAKAESVLEGDASLSEFEGTEAKPITRAALAAEKAAGVQVRESSASGYATRTKHNADAAGATVAIAADHNTAGEKLTQRVAGNKLLKIDIEGDLTGAGAKLAAHMKKLGTTTLNVAGNGIYTLAQTNWDQSTVNYAVYQIIAEAHAIQPITFIVSGGQTGVDIAGAVAAKALGIPAEITLPAGYTQRGVDKVDRPHTRTEIGKQIVDGAAEIAAEVEAQAAYTAPGPKALRTTGIEEAGDLYRNALINIGGINDSIARVKAERMPKFRGDEDMMAWAEKTKGMSTTEVMALVDKGKEERLARLEADKAEEQSFVDALVQDFGKEALEASRAKITAKKTVTGGGSPLAKEVNIETVGAKVMAQVNAMTSEAQIRRFAASQRARGEALGNSKLGRTMVAEAEYAERKLGGTKLNERTFPGAVPAQDADTSQKAQERKNTETQATPSEADIDAVRAQIGRLLGPKIKVLFKEIMQGNGSWDDVTKIVTIALAPLAQMKSVAHHEAMHAFFSEGLKDYPEVKEMLQKAMAEPRIAERLQYLLRNSPKALKAIERDPEEAVAYAFEFWTEKLLDMGKAPATFFEKVQRFIRGVFGMIADSERALEIFQGLYDGKMADPSAAETAIQAAMERGEGLRAKALAMDKQARWVKTRIMAANRVVAETGPVGKALADMWYVNPGSTQQGTEPGVMNRRQLETNKRMNRLMTEVFNGLSDQDMKDLNEAAALKKKPEDVDNQRVAKSLANLYKLNADMYRYVTGAGVQIGTRDEGTYTPMVWNQQYMIEHKDKFVAMLMEHYPQMLEAARATAGQVAAKNLEPQDVAEHMWQAIIDRTGVDAKLDAQREDGVLSPFFASENGRSFDWIAPEHRKEFLSTDLVHTMTAYIHQAVRSAEYVRTFGVGGSTLSGMLERVGDVQGVNKDGTPKRATMDGPLIKEIRAKASADKVPEDQLEAYVLRRHDAVRDSVGAMEGVLGKDISDRARKVNSYLMTYQHLRLLPLSLFAAMLDPIGILVSGGKLDDAIGAYVRGMKGVIKTWKSMATGIPLTMDGDEAEMNALLVGTLDSNMFLEGMGDAHTSEYMDSGVRKVNHAFFKLNGLTAWDRNMRIAATGAAINFITAHDKNANPQHSARWMDGLGLKQGEVIYGADGKMVLDSRVLAQQRAESKAGGAEKFAALAEDKRQALVDGETRVAEQYMNKLHFGIQRFVQRGVLSPNAAVRPAWASDPHYAALFHLKQYTYGFHEIIMRHVKEEAMAGNYGPGLMALTGVPVMIASDITKGLITGGGSLPGYMANWGLADWLTHGWARAGLNGIGQIGLDAVHSPASLLGPTADQIWQTAWDPLGKLEKLDMVPGARIVKGAADKLVGAMTD